MCCWMLQSARTGCSDSRGTGQHVSWLQPAEHPQRQRPQHPPRRQGSLQKPAGFNLSVNKLQSSLIKPAATNLLISRQQGSLQKPAGFNLGLITCRARGIPLSEIRLLHTVIINP